MSDEETTALGTAPSGEAEIGFEIWMDLSAKLLRLDQEARFDLLEERDIDPDDFARAEKRWVTALSDDLSAEEMTRVDRYAARCAAEMRERAAKKQEPPLVAVEAPLATDEAKGIAAPPAAAPLPLVAFESPAATPPPLVATIPMPQSTPALVAGPAPLPLAPVAIDPPPVVRAPAHLSGTRMALDPSVSGRPSALPFGHAPSAEFVAGMAAPRAKTPEASVGGETLPLGVDLLGKLRNELPFLKAPGKAAEPVTTWPRLPLDTYASLCAELSVFPEREPDILKKYGIADDAARRGVDREWGERLSSYPETHVEWQRKVGEFRAWLLRGGQ